MSVTMHWCERDETGILVRARGRRVRGESFLAVGRMYDMSGILDATLGDADAAKDLIAELAAAAVCQAYWRWHPFRVRMEA